jgi:adenylate cyclase
MTPTLDAIRDCLEGSAPALIATCSPDGTPNISYLSHVQYVDRSHVALSYQFFNKTRANVLANPRARLLVVHPGSGAIYRLTLEYLRTESSGPLFESMRATLAGIASHTGMTGVFRLLGSDVYRVRAIELSHEVPGATSERPSRLAALRAAVAEIVACTELYELFATTLRSVHQHFDVSHSMLLLVDRAGQRLYTVASRGYPSSGVGSEIPIGAGIVGVAVREATAIRLSRAGSAYAYGRAIREAAEREGDGEALEKAIPFPGLVRPGSQLAVPIPMAGDTVGALLVESEDERRFDHEDEDALVALVALVGQAMYALQHPDETETADEAAPAHADGAKGPPLRVRHYAADHSVFLDDEYLIKGVAGAIFWAIVSDHASEGRRRFSNRELRLDPRIRLPDLADNLEARLVLLQRRLAERCEAIELRKTGRGRFELSVKRPLRLEPVS